MGRKPAPPTNTKPRREITNSIGMKMVLIPPGEFMMGAPEDEKVTERTKPRNIRSE